MRYHIAPLCGALAGERHRGLDHPAPRACAGIHTSTTHDRGLDSEAICRAGREPMAAGGGEHGYAGGACDGGGKSAVSPVGTPLTQAFWISCWPDATPAGPNLPDTVSLAPRANRLCASERWSSTPAHGSAISSRSSILQKHSRPRII